MASAASAAADICAVNASWSPVIMRLHHVAPGQACLPQEPGSVCTHFTCIIRGLWFATCLTISCTLPHIAAPRPAPIGAGPLVVEAALPWEGAHAPVVRPIDRFRLSPH